MASKPFIKKGKSYISKDEYKLEEDLKIIDAIEDTSIIKLFFNNSRKYNCLPTINWGIFQKRYLQ